MKKIAISFCFIILSYLMLTGPAHAGWVQTNCVLVKITINSESDGWRWECDLEYLPDPSSGLDSGGGSGNGAKPDDKLIGELIMKLITEYKPPCQASNESSTAYAVRAQADCNVHVLGGITRAFPVLTGAIPMATIAGAANACRLLITVDLPSSGGAPICK
jgi:hypothetical protein